MLIASPALAERSALESASVKAASDCVAAAALNPLNAMRLLHDQIYGQGTGRTFLRGDYLDDLPRAVRERIKVELLRRIVQNSNAISGSGATAPGGVAPTPPPSTLPGGMAPAPTPP
jgi:hypothetical protein